MKKSIIAYSVHAALLASTVGFTSQAFSAEESESKKAEKKVKGIEVIMIRAQKRVENLQEVPMSLTAFSEESIEKNQLSDISDIAGLTPNFSYSSFGGGRPEFTIRGIGTSGVTRAGLDNAVITFVDGVYISRASASTFELFDLESISVLRGPQGTLMGKNVVGGAVNINTKKPTQDFELKAKVNVGSEGLVGLQGYINGGLTDNFSGKLTFSTLSRDGLGYDTISNQELSDRDAKSVRGQLYYDAGNDLSLLFTADYTKENNNGSISSEAGDATSNPVIPTDNDPFTSSHGVIQHVDTEQYGLSLKAELETSLGTVTSVTAYRDSSWDSIESFTPETLPATAILDIFDNDETADQFTQELRLTSDTDNRLQWITGAFFIKEKINRTECEEIETNGNQPGFINGVGFVPQVSTGRSCWDNTNETSGWAVFFDGSYDLSESIKIRLGARYTEEKKENYINATAQIPQIIEPHDVFSPSWPLGQEYETSAEKTFSGFTPRIVVEWSATDSSLVYFNVSKGFKSGGFDGKVANNNSVGDTGVGLADTPFKEEDAINYELGAKTQWLDNTLRINGSIFHSEFKDMQRLILVPTGGLAVVNAASATVDGLEIDVVAMLNDDWQLNVGYGFLDATFDDFVIPNAFGPDDDRSGQTLPNSPKNKFTLGSTYTHYLANDGSLTFYGSYSYTDELHSNRESEPAENQDAYSVFNGNISYLSPSENWKFTLWGKNLTDEVYYNKRGRFLNSSGDMVADPITFGISVTYNHY